MLGQTRGGANSSGRGCTGGLKEEEYQANNSFKDADISYSCNVLYNTYKTEAEIV